MVSVHHTYKIVTRLSSRPIGFSGHRRAFSNASRSRAAQNFTMPAMSPTMTEGNIASWKVKEGDSFATGDVLLEIETDKAQMDVEAQEDGKLAKITQDAGAKGVKVGRRIAIVAEPDDDLSSLELPAEEPPKESSTSNPESSKASESKTDPPTTSQGDAGPSKQASTTSSSSSNPQKQTYPLYPSIVQLLHENGLSKSDADKIPASGPKGRLLKGDVLAYLGSISLSYSSQQSTRISKLGHLDLSNAKPAPPKESAQAASPASDKSEAEAAPAPQPELELEPDTEIAVPISLSSVLAVQKRIQDSLGVTLPLSTFIARAVELANDELPRSAQSKPTADELFNDVLGLNKVGGPGARKGTYMPQITALPATGFLNDPKPARHPDVYDILTGQKPSTAAGAAKKAAAVAPRGIAVGSSTGNAPNLCRVSAAKGEEKRVRIFLERMKTILQVEPGRLIL